jgi:hypothetical protein
MKKKRFGVEQIVGADAYPRNRSGKSALRVP